MDSLYEIFEEEVELRKEKDQSYEAPDFYEWVRDYMGDLGDQLRKEKKELNQ